MTNGARFGNGASLGRFIFSGCLGDGNKIGSDMADEPMNGFIAGAETQIIFDAVNGRATDGGHTDTNRFSL